MSPPKKVHYCPRCLVRPGPSLKRPLPVCPGTLKVRRRHCSILTSDLNPLLGLTPNFSINCFLFVYTATFWFPCATSTSREDFLILFLTFRLDNLSWFTLFIFSSVLLNNSITSLTKGIKNVTCLPFKIRGFRGN